jgi:hypothetical protein
MFTDTMSEWILRADGALCLSGYTIRIKPNRHGADIARLPFLVVSDWHRQTSTHMDLESAKRLARKLAREIDAFTMPDTPEGVSQFEDAATRAKATVTEGGCIRRGKGSRRVGDPNAAVAIGIDAGKGKRTFGS